MNANVERRTVSLTEREAVVDDAVAPKPDGPLAAVLLAAGIGSFTLGLLTTLAEANEGLRGLLNLNAGVGPLSGKTIGATLAFVVAWGVLHAMWRDRDRILPSVTVAFVVLTLLGLVGTFPLVFQAFAPE